MKSATSTLRRGPSETNRLAFHNPKSAAPSVISQFFAF